MTSTIKVEARKPEVKVIKVSDIAIESRVREDFGDLKILVQSIRENGLIQPITVKRNKDDKFTLLAGGRRLAALQLLKIEEVPVNIFPLEMTDLNKKEIELYENLHRLNLTWQEQVILEEQIHNLRVEQKGEKIARSKDAPGHSLRDTAKELGKSHGAIASDIKMANLIREFPELAKCKSKKDAQKIIETIQKAIVRSDNVERLEGVSLEVHQERLISSYILGDFLIEGLKIPKWSVCLVEIDPPYGIDLGKNKKADSKQDKSVKMFGYNEVNIEDYDDFLFQTLTIAHNVLEPNGWLILWFDIKKLESITRIVRETGFQLKEIPAIWIKPTGQTNQPTIYMGNCVEYFLYARKGSDFQSGAFLNKPGRRNVFEFNIVSYTKTIHPTERPIEMMEEILETFVLPGKDKKVLVPFLGSGNTLLAAANLGMEAWGYDLTKIFKDAYIERVLESGPPDYKSYK